MSDIYKEAIVEAKRLREIAEEDAKNSIIEDLTPYIKKHISSGLKENYDFFTEQEEPLEDETAQQDPNQLDMEGENAASEENVSDPVSDDDLGQGLGNETSEAPIETNAADDDEAMNAELDPEDGKIVVDFEDLFAGDEEEAIEPADETGAEEAAPTDEMAAGEEATQDIPVQQDAQEPAQDGEPQEVNELEDDLEENPTVPEAVTHKKFNSALNEVSEKIDRAFWSSKISNITKESLKTQLFGLLEKVDRMKENGQLTSKQAKLKENKLEFLFLKLKEGDLSNSYTKKGKNKEDIMASLKEYAAKLLEQDEKENIAQDTQSSGKTGMKTDGEASEHAAEVSGVDPNIGETEDLKASPVSEEVEAGTAGSVDEPALPNTDNPTEEQWAEGEPSLEEEDQEKTVAEALKAIEEEVEAEGHAGFGDTAEDPSVEYEIDDGELKEALRSLEKSRKLREASSGKKTDEENWEDADPEGGEDPSHSNLEEQYMSEREDVELSEQEEDPFAGVDDVVDVVDEPAVDEPVDEVGDYGDEDVDLTLNVDLPDEAEEELVGTEDEIDVDVDVHADAEDFESEDDFGAEDDMGDMDDMPMDSDSEEDEELLTDEDMYEGKGMRESKLRKARRLRKLREARKARARKTAVSKGKRSNRSNLVERKMRKLELTNKKLRKELQESNVFLAKNICFTKLSQDKRLSKKHLKQIAEHLDKAKSVKDTKRVYSKIRNKINEAFTSNKSVGSASQATKSGGASLNESANHTAAPGTASVERWQRLANIKKGNS